MNNKFNISVIVPVYNVESVLPKCIDSILNQSYENFEVILIDDGSFDNSGQICDMYAENDDRVCVIHQKNGGVSHARNKGIQKSRGNYLVFIDSDDWVDPDFFSLLDGYFNDFDIIFLGLDFVTIQGLSVQRLLPPSMSSKTNSFADVLYSLFKMNLLGYMCSIAIRRDIVIKYSLLFDKSASLNEDTLFCYSYCMYAKTFVSLHAAPYKYVRYDNTSRLTLSNNMPPNYLNVLELKLEKMDQLMQHVQMPDKKKNFILGRLMYDFCRISIDQACRSENNLDVLKSVLFNFSKKKMTVCSVKERILLFFVRIKNPYLIYMMKRFLYTLKKE